LQVQQTKTPGTVNYYGGLLPSVGMEWRNTRKLGDKEYIDLGKTFSTSTVKAQVGDVITCEVLELLPDEEKKVLAWLGARPIDVDKTRKEPYTAAQAIDIAKRGQVLQKAAREIVPGTGSKNAKIAFIGASPGPIEAARGEPFVGPCGETLNELYLKPLGLTRKDVFLTNVVPVLLTDDRGRVREPNEQEIEEWRDWLYQELDKANPQIVVALGQTAKSVLGDRADFVLPHPVAVRRFGDSGEVARKVKQIKQALKQVKKADRLGEEGDTRAEVAAKLYEEEWHNMYPKSGRGRWVYQMHWRGLTEEETKLSHEELLKTNHSVHGDLRFQIDDETAWGFSVFEGDTEDIRKTKYGSRLLELPPDDSLQGQFKLFQPVEWITITDKEPYISEPGGPGSTSQTYSKFFKLDGGEYKFSFAREHGRELFLDGKHLKGRLLIQYAPMEQGRRVWLVNRPKSQEPYTKTHDLADVISELKQKGQKWLLWADEPGKPVQKIDVAKAKVAKEYHAAILKADEKQIVTGVVLEPDTVDSQGDVISAQSIEDAAYRFMLKSRVIGYRHSKKAKAEVVESYTAPQDLEINGHKVKKGSWIMSVHISDDNLWRQVKEGVITGFSVGGFGIREEVV